MERAKLTSAWLMLAGVVVCAALCIALSLHAHGGDEPVFLPPPPASSDQMSDVATIQRKVQVKNLRFADYPSYEVLLR